VSKFLTRDFFLSLVYLSIVYFGINMQVSWMTSTFILGILGLSFAIPANAQFQQFPVQQGLPNPPTPFDRSPQQLTQPSSGFQPFLPQTASTETCNSGQGSLSTWVGIPQDQSIPPRISRFTIPPNTCLRVDSQGNTQAVLNQQLGNQNIFSFCQYVNVRGQQGFFNSRFEVECRRNDGQVDRIRTRGSNFFDQLRRDDGRNGGEIQPR
jgi:hypothetical protein